MGLMLRIRRDLPRAARREPRARRLCLQHRSPRCTRPCPYDRPTHRSGCRSRAR